MRNNQNRDDTKKFVAEWTKKEEKILLANWGIYNSRKLVSLLPRFTMSSIRAKAWRLGLPKKRVYKLPPEQKKRGRPRVPKGIIAFEPEQVRLFDSVKDAAAYYNVEPDRIYSLVRTGGHLANGTTFNYTI